MRKELRASQKKENGGRVWAELSEVPGEYDVTTSDFSIKQTKGYVMLDLRYCDKHPSHNRFLFDLWKVSGKREVKTEKTNPLVK